MIPIAVLQVVRAPRNNEPAVVEVRELFGSLNADTRIIPLDTTGVNVRGRPVAVPAGRGSQRDVCSRSIAPAVLPSLDNFVLFDLTSTDGMKVGDEVVDLSGARGAEGRRRADAAGGRDRAGDRWCA